VMDCDPCNHALKIRESTWNSNSQHWSSLESVRVHSLTLFALSGACDVTPESSSWPATLQPLALVASPRIGLQHEWYPDWYSNYQFFLVWKLAIKNWSYPIAFQNGETWVG
jgi:hypothetical protein